MSASFDICVVRACVRVVITEVRLCIDNFDATWFQAFGTCMFAENMLVYGVSVGVADSREAEPVEGLGPGGSNYEGVIVV